jgi:transposase
VKGFAQTPVERLVFEPTGPYHRAFERALGAAGVPFVKVNPRQARRFAEAIGKLARPIAWMRRCWRAWGQC